MRTGVVLTGLGCLTLGGCGAEPVRLAPCALPVPSPVVWLIDYGWHTEVIVPAAQIQGDLATIGALFPGAKTLSFGFGKRSFMTVANPGVLDFISGTVPGPGTVRVIPLPAEPALVYADPVIQVPLSPTEWAGLSDFLWRSFAHQPDGAPTPISGDSTGGSRFFASTPGYTLAYTCNTWSVDGLEHAGLPVNDHVLFSSGAMHETATLHGACTPR